MGTIGELKVTINAASYWVNTASVWRLTLGNFLLGLAYKILKAEPMNKDFNTTE